MYSQEARGDFGSRQQIILAELDDPRFGATGPHTLLGRRRSVFATWAPAGGRKSGEPKKNERKYVVGGATLPRLYPLARFRPLWVCVL